MKTPKLKDKTAGLTQTKATPHSDLTVDEAISEILLEKYFTLCSNNSVYTLTKEGYLIEIPDLTYETFPEFDSVIQPTEVDSMNGISWKGYFTVNVKNTHRKYDRYRNKWSIYKEGAGLNPLTFDLTNIDGKWVCKACENYSPADCNSTVENAIRTGEKPTDEEKINSRKSFSDYFNDFFNN